MTGLFKLLKSFHMEEEVTFILYSYTDQNGQYKLGGLQINIKIFYHPQSSRRVKSMCACFHWKDGGA